MAQYNYTELTRDDGMTSAVSTESCTSRAVYRLRGASEGEPPPVSALSGFCSYLLGSVDNLEPKVTTRDDPHAGKVRRTLPRAHPYLPDTYVAGTGGITGVGTQTEAASSRVLYRDPVTDEFPMFPEFDYEVTFSRRPYFLLADDQIGRTGSIYTKPDGTTTAYYYAEEWRRYTTFTIRPLPDTVTAQVGQMKFRVDGGGSPDGTNFMGNQSVFLENQLLEYMWYCVPLRYLRNTRVGDTVYRSYLTRYVNTVNQAAWLDYDPGQVLFLGAEPTEIYKAPISRVQKVFGVGVGVSQDLCCNIKMRFLLTQRVGTSLPTSGFGLANANNIANGHNLEPNFADRKFYYVTSVGPAADSDTTKWFAKYRSFPTQLLWTDPMLTQPEVI